MHTHRFGYLFYAAILTVVFSLYALQLPAQTSKTHGQIGTFEKWGKVEIVFEGPELESAGSPNPFSIELDISFFGPSGQTYVVPGFYDGDGRGGIDGNIWKVRFSADVVGTWSYSTASTDSQLDGVTGSFWVTGAPADAPDFYRWGRLEYMGAAGSSIRYFKFRDGPYWLKAGCDDPENFLGSFSNYNTPTKRKAAIDYLANEGINSMYMITHNIDGDNNDVWPWLGDSRSEAKANGGDDSRFDIVRLKEWRDLFEYMQARGVVPYLVLEDDSPWSGYDHERYYREMIARFGDLPALLFNLGEEYVESPANNLSSGIQFAALLKDIDPYNHPVAIHDINSPNSDYIDAVQLDFTSIQTKGTDPLVHNSQTIAWINLSKTRGKRIPVINYDEPRPLLDRKGWWSAFIGGGVWEAHVDKPYDRPMSTWETAWRELGGARLFMESLPFWQMEPSNTLVISGQAFCLARTGEVYALYLPQGGSVTVDLTQGIRYAYQWWNASNGRSGNFESEGATLGGPQQFTAPGSGDWALRIVKSSGDGNSAPVVSDSTINMEPGTSETITLAYSDPDGPGPYLLTVTELPSVGELTLDGNQALFSAPDNVEGETRFRWIVDDGINVSSQATVTINFNTGNKAPLAANQTIQHSDSVPLSIPLSYEDPDTGPGPFTFAIVIPPQNGTLENPGTGDNDFIYTPDPGFSGVDQFSWKVNDGEADSNTAIVTIEFNDITPPSKPEGLEIQFIE